MPVTFADRTQVPGFLNLLGNALSAGGQGFAAAKSMQKQNPAEMGGPPTDQIVGGPVAPAAPPNPMAAAAPPNPMAAAQSAAGAGGAVSPVGLKGAQGNNQVAALLQMVNNGGGGIFGA